VNKILEKTKKNSSGRELCFCKQKKICQSEK